MTRPKGWSRWTHREKGGDYTVLTIAKGAGPDRGVEFVYYLGNGQAFVRRLNDWDRAMAPHPTAENAYEKRLAELQGDADGDLDDFDLGDVTDFDLGDL